MRKINIMSFSKFIFFSLSLFCVFFCSACYTNMRLADIVARAPKREEMLTKAVDDFTQGLYWGSIEEAAQKVAPESREAFRRTAAMQRRVEKYVELKVINLSFLNNSKVAEVELEIKYYRQPEYTVKTRIERQYWEHRIFDGGWYLLSSAVSDEPAPVKLEEEYKGFKPEIESK